MSRNVQSELRARWGARGTAAASIASRLTFEDISRSFGAVDALSKVTLDIEPGEVVCLLGPSGCGKTTLLRIAAGIEQPNSGRVLLDGNELVGPAQYVPPERRNIGLMFQDFALFPHLNILQNVAFGLRGLPKSEIDRTAQAALARVGLAHYADEYPHILSGGEQQRVALARAVAPRPGVLLMDEPFSGLDVNLRESMQNETLAVLRETRATSIIVTHDPEEAMRMANRIAVMDRGRLIQVGTAEELYRHPNQLFVARFFSDVNEIRCKVADGLVQTPLTDEPISTKIDADAVIMCVRERGVRILPEGKGHAGRVINVSFLGDAALVELAVQGLEQHVMARLDESAAPGIGDNVGVSVSTSAVLVFPAQNGADTTLEAQNLTPISTI